MALPSFQSLIHNTSSQAKAYLASGHDPGPDAAMAERFSNIPVSGHLEISRSLAAETVNGRLTAGDVADPRALKT
jgi:hypothetical protein